MRCYNNNKKKKLRQISRTKLSTSLHWWSSRDGDVGEDDQTTPERSSHPEQSLISNRWLRRKRFYVLLKHFFWVFRCAADESRSLQRASSLATAGESGWLGFYRSRGAPIDPTGGSAGVDGRPRRAEWASAPQPFTSPTPKSQGRGNMDDTATYRCKTSESEQEGPFFFFFFPCLECRRLAVQPQCRRMYAVYHLRQCPALSVVRVKAGGSGQVRSPGVYFLEAAKLPRAAVVAVSLLSRHHHVVCVDRTLQVVGKTDGGRFLGGACRVARGIHGGLRRKEKKTVYDGMVRDHRLASSMIPRSCRRWGGRG